MQFQGKVGLSGACRRKSLSYSSYAEPPWNLISCFINLYFCLLVRPAQSKSMIQMTWPDSVSITKTVTRTSRLNPEYCYSGMTGTL